MTTACYPSPEQLRHDPELAALRWYAAGLNRLLPPASLRKHPGAIQNKKTPASDSGEGLVGGGAGLGKYNPASYQLS